MSFFTQQTQVIQIDDRNTITVRKPTNAERNQILDAIMPVASDENQVASKICDPKKRRCTATGCH